MSNKSVSTTTSAQFWNRTETYLNRSLPSWISCARATSSFRSGSGLLAGVLIQAASKPLDLAVGDPEEPGGTSSAADAESAPADCTASVEFAGATEEPQPQYPRRWLLGQEARPGVGATQRHEKARLRAWACLRHYRREEMRASTDEGATRRHEECRQIRARARGSTIGH
jgi:hypothetical protein